MEPEVGLTLPQMRAEIIAAIRDLTEPLAANPAEDGIAGFFETYLLLMEDASLGEDPRRGIGGFLRDEREAAAFELLREPLEAVVTEVGRPYAPDAAYEAAPSWPSVPAAAKRALEVFEARSDARGSGN